MAADTVQNDSAVATSWEEALADYRQKRAASDAMPLGAEGEDEAIDAYCEALDYLVQNVPAPSAEALQIKMDLVEERYEGYDLDAKVWRALSDDVRQLRAPAQAFAEAWIDRWKATGGGFALAYNADGSVRAMMHGMLEPSFWEPTDEGNLSLPPHTWLTEKDHQGGAKRVLEALLIMVPELQETVREMVMPQLLSQHSMAA